MVELSEDERLVLNCLQGGFPVCERPYRELETILSRSADSILEALKSLENRGLLSRFGAVLNTRAMGGDSRLAAMAVPPDRLSEVVERVNGHRSVTHNYQRDHRMNLWFVLSGSRSEVIDRTLKAIQEKCGLRVFDLPKITEYYVGLQFQFGADGSVRTVHRDDASRGTGRRSSGRLNSFEQTLIRHLQEGLPIKKRPYRALAGELGWSQARLRMILRTMRAEGKIKRLGCVPNHYALGIRGNGMAVFDVPNEEVDTVGRRLGRRDEVTHCYRRPRQGGHWPYNLFFMVHRPTREGARELVEELGRQEGLDKYPYEVLFSEKMFKKTGLRLNREPKEGALRAN